MAVVVMEELAVAAADLLTMFQVLDQDKATVEAAAKH
jgi:hypothetical protein